MNAIYFYIGVGATFTAIMAAVVAIIYVEVQPKPTPNNSNNSSSSSIAGNYTILGNYSLDQRYFLEGLEFIDSTHLLLSEGWYGDSGFSILSIDNNLMTMKEDSNFPMSTKYFGEGAVYFPKDGMIYELTWTDGVILVYSNLMNSGLNTTYLMNLPLPAKIGEGWGMTYDNDYLYISNGSTTIFVCDPSPEGLTVVSTITVDTQGRNPHFNELEMRENMYIYANSFLTSDVYKFSKVDGTLLKVWDMSELLQIQTNHVVALGQQNSYDWANNVLNGIAYNATSKTFLLTGKRWDYMFVVDLID